MVSISPSVSHECHLTFLDKVDDHSSLNPGCPLPLYMNEIHLCPTFFLMIQQKRNSYIEKQINTNSSCGLIAQAMKYCISSLSNSSNFRALALSSGKINV